MINLDLIAGILGLLLTVMVFSYLVGDNFFFRLAMNLLIGVSAGYAAAVLIQLVIIPHLVQPLLSGNGNAFYLSLVVCLFALLLLTTFFSRINHLARLPLALLFGLIAAVSIFGLARGTLAPQMLAIVNRFSPELLYKDNLPDWMALVKAAAMLLGVIAVLLYFDHHVGRWQGNIKITPLSENASGVGRVFIGITFGAIFAGVFATALLALIGRIAWIQNLLSVWLGF
ncbi:MAG TPA: hypothetical protein VLR89_03620 [Anaerolineaceae bacterium]|nr:hypothetical protein [Anaerolineaceae bacterium]